MNILSRYLKKIGVKEFSELNNEEKETYRRWEESLKGRKITDDEVSAFFEVEINDTINKLIGEGYNEREDIFLKVKLEFLRKAKTFLGLPEMEKKMLEASINNQINQN